MRYIASCVFAFIATICSFAQTVQLGIVKEYNEKAQKTPLSGVALNVRSAGSTVSDNKGSFSLRFLTLKPGERINVRRIEKLGYEVFNKEAIEQWNLSPKNPFIIVMCRSDKFKRIRDNYERVSSESYARQLKKEEAELKKLRAAGKLKDAEYQKQIFELRENYEKQLDNLENYIDKFSRVDLSEISETEQQIIELVQQGKIDEAIAKYENLNLIDKYKKESENILEISNTIDRLADLKLEKNQSRDSLLAKIERHIDVLTLAGGQASLKKAANMYTEVADIDTTNITWQIKTSMFLAKSLSDYKGALVYALRALNQSANVNGKNDQITGTAYSNCGTIMYLLGKYDSAQDYTERALHIQENLESQNFDDISTLYYNWGNIYSQQGNYEKALDKYNQSIKILSDNNIVDSIHISFTYNSIGTVYEELGNHEEAFKYVKKALDIRLKHCPEDKRLIASSFDNLGFMYRKLGQYNSALQYSLRALEMAIELYGPEHIEVAKSYESIASIYGELGDFEKAMDYYNKAMDIEQKIYEIHPNIAELYNNMAVIYNSTGYHDKALELYQKALDIHIIVLGEHHKSVANSYNNIGYTYSEMGDRVKALEYYFKALDIYISIFGDDNPNIGDLTNNIGTCYYHLGDTEKALQYMERTLNNRISAYGNDHPYTALALNNIANIYDTLGEYDKAIEYYTRALGIYKSVYGEQHFSVALVYDNLSTSYYKLKDFASAINMGIIALNIRKAVYGDSHKDVAISCNNLGNYYWRAKDYENALECFSNARKIWQTLYGEDDSKAIDMTIMLGYVYKKMGKFDSTFDSFFDALERKERLLGKNHPDVAKLNFDIADAYYDTNDFRNAIVKIKETTRNIKSIDDKLYSYAMQMLYMSYTNLLKDDSSIAEEFEDFMTDKIFVGRVNNEDTPAGKYGLKGEYFIVEFDDWDCNSSICLFDKITELQGMPKNLSIVEDGKIRSYHFDNLIGMQFSIKTIDVKTKQSIVSKYMEWKRGLPKQNSEITM